VAFTTARGGGTHGRASPSAPELLRFPLLLFDFLYGFLILTDILCLKEGCIWPIESVGFIA